DFLRLARQASPPTRLACGDGYRLPFRSRAFDAVYGHYLLLWIAEPLRMLAEMRRVTRPGGALLCMAEPDYGGRIDYPTELASLGRWQADALAGQGADPNVGRKLAGLLVQAGLNDVQYGVLGGEWNAGAPEGGQEWQMIEHDLAGQVEPHRLAALRRSEQSARARGEKVLFVPTFYAAGIVPEE
ncbi:MAG: methyltransferase domain-containing protein, partial [Anaerolineaceae bacterium]|nr:methyltransferase domain-containing protein [Anaerolineaceae bacterium]